MSLYRVYMLSVVLALGGAAGAAQSSVAELLTSSPGQTFEQDKALCETLLKQGPEAIRALCDLVQPSGDDGRVRTVLMDLAVTVGKGAPQQRQMFSQTLCEALKSDADKEIKALYIQLLQYAGGDEAVGTLAGYLNDARLSSPAATALTQIGTEAACNALLESLGRQDTVAKTDVILGLGSLRVQKASGAITALLDHQALRGSARWALANIGDEAAAGPIASDWTKATGYAKSVAGDDYLLLAERLAEKGQKDKALAICKQFGAEAPIHQQIKVLAILASVQGEQAMNDLLAAADSDNVALQAAAVRMGGAIPGAKVTTQWVDKLQKAKPVLAARILGMLGERGDQSAWEAVVKAFGHADGQVVIAAMEAAAKLRPGEAVEPILAVLRQNAQPEIIMAGRDILMRLPGDPPLLAAADALKTMPQGARIALMEGLAGRAAMCCSAALLAQAQDADGSIRLAAMKALSDVAGAGDMPAVIKLMLDSTNEQERTALSRAVVQAALREADKEKQAQPLLEVLPTVSGANQVIVLRCMGRIGGAKALTAVLDAVKSDDAEIKDAGIRALADWPDASALDGLMGIVKTGELKHQVIALRSGLKLLQTSGLSDADKLKRVKEALAAVSRPEEKRLVLGAVGQIKSSAALQLAASYLDDASLQSDAAVSVARIALPAEGQERGLEGYETAKVLKKAVDLIKNEELKQQAQAYLDTLPKTASVKRPVPEGFTALFNGKDLTGWKGVLLPPNDNPVKRAALTPEQRAECQAKADESMKAHWSVEEGVLVFDGQGFSLSTAEEYENFEMYVDWKIDSHGDSGIYLRGSPQVQIWDPADWPEGSGGLYNNQKNPSKPLVKADNPIGEWNTFFIRMVGERVTVYLNGKLVVDNVVMENYWDRSRPIFPSGPIELQCHGHRICFDNIFVRRLPAVQDGGWVTLFNGTDLSGWIGDVQGYVVEGGAMVCRGGKNIFTAEEYADFHLKFDFCLTPGANNGLGIRAPKDGDAAYGGMEIQILDDSSEQYASLKPYQYHGSIYGVVPAKRGHLKPVGQWNSEEVIAKGRHITVILNGVTIVDADITEAIEKGTIDGNAHPGLANERGHIGFLGHGSQVSFKNIRIKTL